MVPLCGLVMTTVASGAIRLADCRGVGRCPWRRGGRG
jgi:hypothetical protein